MFDLIFYYFYSSYYYRFAHTRTVNSLSGQDCRTQSLIESSPRHTLYSHTLFQSILFSYLSHKNNFLFFFPSENCFKIKNQPTIFHLKKPFQQINK